MTCEHSSKTEMVNHGNVTLSECDSCGEVIVTIKRDRIIHDFTPDAIIELKEDLDYFMFMFEKE